MSNISDNMQQINDLQSILAGMQDGHKWGVRKFDGKLEAPMDQSLSALLIWHKHSLVELIPKTVLCNGIEISAALTEALPANESYCTASPVSASYYESYVWVNRPEDFMRLKRGIVHLTYEAAKNHCIAMLTTTYK